MGIKGKDFVLVCTDTSAVHSIITIKQDEDKIIPVDSHKVFCIAGEAGDRVQFSDYIIANVKLYSLRNSTSLSTRSVANYARGELATALRKVSSAWVCTCVQLQCCFQLVNQCLRHAWHSKLCRSLTWPLSNAKLWCGTALWRVGRAEHRLPKGWPSQAKRIQQCNFGVQSSHNAMADADKHHRKPVATEQPANSQWPAALTAAIIVCFCSLLAAAGYSHHLHFLHCTRPTCCPAVSLPLQSVGCWL